MLAKVRQGGFVIFIMHATVRTEGNLLPVTLPAKVDGNLLNWGGLMEVSNPKVLLQVIYWAGWMSYYHKARLLILAFPSSCGGRYQGYEVICPINGFPVISYLNFGRKAGGKQLLVWEQFLPILGDVLNWRTFGYSSRPDIIKVAWRILCLL